MRKHKLGIKLHNGAPDLDGSDLWQVINLLNDDYLTSDASGLPWTANTKTASG